MVRSRIYYTTSNHENLSVGRGSQKQQGLSASRLVGACCRQLPAAVGAGGGWWGPAGACNNTLFSWQ